MSIRFIIDLRKGGWQWIGPGPWHVGYGRFSGRYAKKKKRNEHQPKPVGGSSHQEKESGILIRNRAIRRLFDRASTSPQSLKFVELQKLLVAFGFRRRGETGDHEQWKHPDVEAVFTANELGKTNMASAKQVGKLVKAVKTYRLKAE